ncbi:MAG TPA: dTMP kinase [Firmicutes bacterium]|jgi:dTMP kinase|nr:dTMP kinase [Bacillota bacterium]
MGRFIVLEGIDGSGISTQARLLAEYLSAQNRPVLLTKEPSSGPIGALIRQALQGRLQEIEEHTMALLFAADRCDHLQNEILPRLAEGVDVICDRYYLSSFAYQSRQVPLDWLRTLNSGCRVPDLTILLQVPAEVTMERITANRYGTERYEELTQLQEILNNFIAISNTLQKEGERIVAIDATAPIKQVHKIICQQVAKLPIQ